ncbi:ChrR Cupin-like domain protein [Planctomycetes bacterium Poly30]|uniref:ChrR Cupin-like domain protein n=1 Tax=Saltatorellus ferox TaxID=2528018 RepID=A0A518EUG5_9BACT|nr:ChrR Cupin-like domain protein [Planctomycetes bacterium Poly30]
MNIPGLGIDPEAEGADLASLPWRATRHAGIEWLDLVTEDSGRGPGKASTVLIRMAPGCGYPMHRHLGPEDVLVLAGGYRDEDGRTYRAGDFVRYPAGSEHTPVALGGVEKEGQALPACVLFAVAHGGTVVSRDSGPPPADFAGADEPRTRSEE